VGLFLAVLLAAVVSLAARDQAWIAVTVFGLIATGLAMRMLYECGVARAAACRALEDCRPAKPVALRAAQPQHEAQI
jgi:hypothetical protein